jgi:hypothetical protein
VPALLGTCGGGHSAGVRALRPSVGGTAPVVCRLPPATHPRGSCALRVRGAARQGDPGAEVLRVASPGALARGSHDGGSTAASGRWLRRESGHVGPPLPATTRRTRFRPGRGPGVARCREARSRRGPAPGPSARDPGAGDSHRKGASRLASRRVRAHRSGPTVAPPGRRCPDDRGHRGCVRGGAPGERCPPGGRAYGRPFVPWRCPHPLLRPRVRTTRGRAEGALPGPGIMGWARAWVCGCPEDVPPVVDASRRRNDPRKATFGC